VCSISDRSTPGPPSRTSQGDRQHCRRVFAGRRLWVHRVVGRAHKKEGQANTQSPQHGSGPLTFCNESGTTWKAGSHHHRVTAAQGTAFKTTGDAVTAVSALGRQGRGQGDHRSWAPCPLVPRSVDDLQCTRTHVERAQGGSKTASPCAPFSELGADVKALSASSDIKG
jgi:hypothetical protein